MVAAARESVPGLERAIAIAELAPARAVAGSAGPVAPQVGPSARLVDMPGSVTRAAPPCPPAALAYERYLGTAALSAFDMAAK